MSRMLLCEPQADLATALLEFFSGDNFTVELEANGKLALEHLRHKHYDVIILESALHELDGLSVIREYRSDGGNAPIFLLTGKFSSLELQQAFDAGADAYLAKPFNLEDLAARLRALLRRPALRNAKILCLGSLALNTESGTVTRDGQLIHLFPMEYKVLEFLMSHPNQVFNAAAIFEQVWQKSAGIGDFEDTVRTHIRTLRSKIDKKGSSSFISNVRGLGYKTEDRFDTDETTRDCGESQEADDFKVLAKIE